MSKALVIDDQLHDIIKKVRAELPKSGCNNPSYSNALRSLLDMPHISGKGRYDSCGATKTMRGIKLTEGKEEKELES